jgi:hypothetical protein
MLGESQKHIDQQKPDTKEEILVKVICVHLKTGRVGSCL